jgi:archaellum biogenesis ATPase FlaH
VSDLNRIPEAVLAYLRSATELTPLPDYDPTPDPTLARLKELDLRQHLARFEGLGFNGKGTCLCPIHTETSPSFEVKRHTDGHWYWFDWHNQGRDGFSGTIIDYYVTIKGMTVGEAIRTIREREGIEKTAILAQTTPTTTSPSAAATTVFSGERTIELVTRPLSSVTSRQTFYLMQDRIPMGMFTLIVGGGGAGKSTLLTEIACRVSRGEPLPGATAALIPAGSTIYVTTENQPEEVFRPRAIACRGDLSKIHYIRNVLVYSNKGPGELQIFDIGHHLPALAKTLDKIGDVRVTIIDPLISHINEKIDDSRAKPVRKLLDTLSDFAEQKKVAILGVSHVAKGVASSAAAKAAGSHQWIDASRVALGVAKDKEDPSGKRRFLSTLKSNIYVTWKTLAFNIIDTSVQDDASPELSLRAGRVEFEAEEVDIDVEAIFNPDRLTESMTVKAIRLFDNELKNGPRPAEEIWSLAESLGITEGSYKYARRKRGIHAEKLGGKFGTNSDEEKWVLWLPEHWDARQSSRRG